jgi:WD domain, G-beta repeat
MARPWSLSPDGRFLALGGYVARYSGIVEPSIRLIEVASGQEVATLTGHEEGTRGLAFSPDGRLLASASGSNNTSNDATVRVWDIASGLERRRLEGHLAAVNAVAFTPDGRSIVSGSDDATALVWDVSDLRAEPKSHSPLAPAALRARWEELADSDARGAYRAAWALSVPSAVPFLRERLRTATSPEPKAMPAARGPIETHDVLRNLRAIAALERAGTPEACAALQGIARGNTHAVETREAKSALDRLSRRPQAQAGSSMR